MKIRTFKRILKHHWDDSIQLGGGEPTLHPKFWEILGLAIASCDNVWLATNGSITKTSIALAKLAQNGVIGCALSQDEWHDSIDESVIKAFNSNRLKYNQYSEHPNDLREIRTIIEPFTAGRCDFGKEGCACEDINVLPNGDIRQCGCMNAPIIGSVFDDKIKFTNDYEDGDCFNKEKVLA